MKNGVLVGIVILTLISCQKEMNDYQLIESFIHEIILTDDFKFSKTKRYIDFDNDYMKDEEETKELILEFIEQIKQELKANNSVYQIVTHQKAKEMEIELKFRCDIDAPVYHLLSNEKLITSIVIENGKIASFFYMIFIKSQSELKIPWFLNNNDHNKLEH
jgi:hypothetical protein